MTSYAKLTPGRTQTMFKDQPSLTSRGGLGPFSPPAALMRHLGSFAVALMVFVLGFASEGRLAYAQDEKKAAPAPAADAKAADAKPAEETAPPPPATSPTAGQASESAPKASTNRLIWVYQAEGIFFFPQLLMSILIVAMIVMYGMQSSRSEFLPPKFVEEMENALKDRKHQEAYDLAKSNNSVIAKVITAGLVRLSAPGTSYNQAMEAMQEVGEDEGMKYDHKVSYLAMMGNIATMVGLLGTVWGMVASFMVIADSDTTPKPKELAQGVSQALVTTVWGLLQAIPAIIAFTILKNRYGRMMLEVGIISERLLNKVVQSAAAPKKPTTPAAPAGGA